MKRYDIQMEISGPTAMWTRPDTGDAPVSYPLPTFSAAKGLFESVVRLENVEIAPTQVEICAPVLYHNYATNYGGPLRKSKIMPHGSYQLLGTVLINVCYRLYAEVKPAKFTNPSLSERARFQIKKGCNSLHACQDMFNRRLEKGQWHDIPFLGWREFVPSYIGPFRETTTVQDDVNFDLPSFLFSVFEPAGGKTPSPIFNSNIKVRNGRLRYAE